MLYYFALNYVKDDIAEDVVQEVFLKIWQKRDEIEFKTSVKSYLFTMVRNSCLSYIEKRNVRYKYKQQKEQQVLGNQSFIADYKNGSFLLIEKENDKILDAALNKLTPKSHQVFLLNREENKKYREIASELNVSIKTVEKHMTSALKSLRGSLALHLN